MVRISRIFYGGYIPNNDVLLKLNVSRFYFNGVKTLYTPTNSNNGLGKIKGKTQKKGVIYPGVEVSVFKRSDKTPLWTVRSKSDGSYEFRNILKGLECFVVGFDPEQNYNAVISDKLVAK